MHRDYLGSILAITNSSLQIVEDVQFGAWGVVDNFSALNSSTTFNHESLLGRGYTGHEHFFEVGLIHMNGRMYDAKLGRFLSPDNFIQDPYNTQNYNRYGYVWNNPLNHVDKNGEFFSFITAIFDTFKNIFTYGVNFDRYDYHSTQMAWKIDMGQFKGNFGQILSRFTWEGTQNAIGYTGTGIHNLFGGVRSVDYYDGATVVESYSSNWGGVTIGSYINGERGIRADPNNSLFQHEYGHYLQSQASGPLYISKFGLPSLASKGDHNLHPTEQDANVRALRYFNDTVGGFNGIDAAGNPISSWDFGENPIIGYDPTMAFNSAINQMALSNNFMSLKISDYLHYASSGAIPTGLINIFLQNKNQ